jgi:O-antigen ligase
MKGEVALRREDVLLWLSVAVFYLLLGLAAYAEPVVGLLLLALGVLFTLFVLLVASERGVFMIALTLIVTVLVLPGDVALEWRIPVGGGGIFIIDLLLAALVAGWLLQAVSRGELPLTRSPVTLPLVLFLAWTGVAAYLGVERGNDLKVILQDARGLGYYFLFIWAVTTVRNRRQILVLLGVLAVSLVIGFAMGVVYSFLGEGQQIGFVEAGTSRFPAPNEVFVLGVAIVGTMMVVWPAGRPRPRFMWVLLSTASLGVVLSLVRGYWLGLAVGGLYLFLIVRTQQRMRLVGGVVALVTVLGLTLAALQPQLFSSVVSRAAAITAYGDDPSAQYRLIENRAVLQQVYERPLEGKGLGSPYLFDFSRYGVSPYYKVYIHNNYLWFAQRLGLVGLGLFIWAALAFLLAWHRWRPQVKTGDPYLWGLVVGARVMLVTVAVVSVTSPQFNAKGNVAVIALIMGLAEVAGALLRDGSEDGLLPSSLPSRTTTASPH